MRYLFIPKLSVCVFLTHYHYYDLNATSVAKKRKEVSMQFCSFTSVPPGVNAIFVIYKQQYVLFRKYCYAYKSIPTYPKPKCWNNSIKITESDENLK